MKLLGMIGGTGPESTIDYYRLLIAAFRERRPDGGSPPLIINSIAGDQLLNLLNTNDLAGVTATLLPELRRLEQAGVEIGLLTSCTLHIVFDDLRRSSPIPLISIVEATAEAVEGQRLKRVGLFGTRLTMTNGFFHKVFEQAGIELVTPDTTDQEYIDATYFTELVRGVFREQTRKRFVAIAQGMKQHRGIEGLILGGTELPLLLRDANDIAIPVFDATRLHVERAVRELL